MASNTTLCANTVNVNSLNAELQSPVVVTIKTADYSILADDVRKNTLFTNRGDGDALNLTLPAVEQNMAGHVMHVLCAAAQKITITGNPADNLIVNGDSAADSIVQNANTLSSLYKIWCDGSNFIVIGLGNTPGGTAAVRYDVST